MAIISLSATFESGFCNYWPEIELLANEQTLWRGYIKKRAAIAVEFPALPYNRVCIKYLNKRNGPDVWDTRVDDQGSIVEDQYCVLTGLMINRARCDWFIERIPYRRAEGQQEFTFGYMAFQGSLEFDLPRDVYQWIVEQRQSDANIDGSPTSSLNYKNIYIPMNQSKDTLQLIANIKGTLSSWYDKKPGN